MLTIEQLSKQMISELAAEEARLDIRLNAVHKKFLKQVYKQAGYRSLSAFILQAAIEKAESIVEKDNMILASERDKKLFFTSLLETAAPNEALIRATESYNESIQ